MPSPERLQPKYTSFYHDVAEYPAIPKFRLFGSQWAKRLNDGSEDIARKEAAVNTALAKVRLGVNFPLTMLNCPRSFIKEGIEKFACNYEERKPWEDVDNLWTEYERSLRTYSQDLCLVHEMYKLPDHSPYFGKYLRKYTSLFANDIYGPTGDAAGAYKDTASTDFRAVIDVTINDVLSNLYIYYSDWMEAKVWSRFRPHRPNATQQPKRTDFELKTIQSAMDVFACVFVPLMLTATMFVLVAIRPLRPRIGVAGALGLVFALAAKILAGHLSRGEIFAYTAAYFAVASVFVGTAEESVFEGGQCRGVVEVK